MNASLLAFVTILRGAFLLLTICFVAFCVVCLLIEAVHTVRLKLAIRREKVDRLMRIGMREANRRGWIQ